MGEEEYQRLLSALREDWGSVSIDPELPGVLRAHNDPTTGLMAGRRARLFAEIINRALDAQ